MLKSLEALRDDRPDLILLAATLPGSGGLEVLRHLRAVRPEIPVIMLSAFATVRGAVEAMKRGACDYLIKPFSAEELLALVDKVVERNRLLEENRSLKAEIRRRFDPDQVIFRRAAFQRIFDLARKVAPAAAGVLILGESGTGKELIASTIHYSSRRREERNFREDLFYRLNVATIRVPPLRDRREDIGALAEHFLSRFSTRGGQRISPEAMAQLKLKFEFPGLSRQYGTWNLEPFQENMPYTEETERRANRSWRSISRWEIDRFVRSLAAAYEVGGSRRREGVSPWTGSRTRRRCDLSSRRTSIRRRNSSFRTGKSSFASVSAARCGQGGFGGSRL